MATVPVRALGPLIALAALSVADSAATAQEPREGERPHARGRVVDLHTESPIPNAVIGFDGSGRMTFTDSLGAFALEAPPAWEYHLTVRVLGYEPTRFTVTAEQMERPLIIALRPDPIALEGLEVLVDRFQRRRNFYPGSVQTLDQSRLAVHGISTAYEIVRRRVLGLRRCPAAMGLMDDMCVFRRGRMQKTEVCIDEAPAFGGVSELEAYSATDLYLVEIYDRGLAIRVYTNWYVERALQDRRRLRPLIFGC